MAGRKKTAGGLEIRHTGAPSAKGVKKRGPKSKIADVPARVVGELAPRKGFGKARPHDQGPPIMPPIHLHAVYSRIIGAPAPKRPRRGK